MKSHGRPNAKKASFLNKLIKKLDWKNTVCDFVIFGGDAVVQLLGTSIEKTRQARAIPKNHDSRVRFRNFIYLAM